MNDGRTPFVLKFILKKQERAIFVYAVGLEKNIDVRPVGHDSINIGVNHLRVLGYVLQFVGQVHEWPPYVFKLSCIAVHTSLRLLRVDPLPRARCDTYMLPITRDALLGRVRMTLRILPRHR